MELVGYLTYTKEGADGVRGLFYDYLLASNGVFIEAKGAWITARVQVAEASIRGLAPLDPAVRLHFGKIPQSYFDLAVGEMMKTPSQERYVAITHNGNYHVHIPEQTDGAAHVKYTNPDAVVVDLHSHGRMLPFFSGEDNRDDQGLRVSGVIGQLDKGPVLALRVGIYGYYAAVAWEDIFEGQLSMRKVEDLVEEIETKEVSDIEPSEDALGFDLFHRGVNWLSEGFQRFRKG